MPSTGSQQDFVSRLRAVLPQGWFPLRAAPGEPNTSPVLDGLLAGPGTIYAAVWKQLAYLVSQTRIATATGFILEMIADDFFGVNVFPRNQGETDTKYRARILAALFPLRITRPAIVAALASLGAKAVIVETRNATDCKGYGSFANPESGGGYGYNMPGMAYGSLLLNNQAFITIDNSAGDLTLDEVCGTLFLSLPIACVAWVQLRS